ncbi:MAG: NAD-dependent epimerase/dehydratase family protein [Chloroflexi bacterium]|nr:NAD-dependent epimerase/dehydratase family protein [Chloroflexota bacterium]MDA1219697.1 NAD-dependent epimerase/dehydratase family protein [Chloroflexota bacterium]
MVEDAKIVAVTGASGYIGSRLLRQLEEENLESLVAIDTKPPPLPIHNLAVYRQDVSKPFDDALRESRVTTLVHLAFVHNRGRNRREIRDIRETNLRTLHVVLDSCARAGVKHVVYLTSHTVYGARRDNAVPLTESSPLRPVADFPFGYDKFLSDQILESFAERHPDIKVTALRCCSVLGPSASKDISRILTFPGPMGVYGYNPPFQFLHEDDLARILSLVIHRGISGVYNLAGDGVVFYQEIVDALPGFYLNLPRFLAFPLVGMTWKMGMQSGRNTSELDLLRFPLLLSTGKLREATGYQMNYTSLETLTSFVNGVLL